MSGSMYQQLDKILSDIFQPIIHEKYSSKKYYVNDEYDIYLFIDELIVVKNKKKNDPYLNLTFEDFLCGIRKDQQKKIMFNYKILNDRWAGNANWL